MAYLKLQTLLLIVACATFVTTSSVVSNADCPQVCPLLFAPVCATNGMNFKEFDNQCELQWINCRLKTSTRRTNSYKEIDMDWCSTDFVDNLYQKLGNLDLTKPECLKPCPMIYAPVCVSNGIYRGLISNACEMELLNCNLGAVANHFKILQDNSCAEPLIDEILD